MNCDPVYKIEAEGKWFSDLPSGSDLYALVLAYPPDNELSSENPIFPVDTPKVVFSGKTRMQLITETNPFDKEASTYIFSDIVGPDGGKIEWASYIFESYEQKPEIISAFHIGFSYKILLAENETYFNLLQIELVAKFNQAVMDIQNLSAGILRSS